MRKEMYSVTSVNVTHYHNIQMFQASIDCALVVNDREFKCTDLHPIDCVPGQQVVIQYAASTSAVPISFGFTLSRESGDGILDRARIPAPTEPNTLFYEEIVRTIRSCDVRNPCQEFISITAIGTWSGLEAASTTRTVLLPFTLA